MGAAHFLTDWKLDFSLVAEVGWESFDNTNDVRYAYDRLIGFVGVRQEFGCC